MALKALELAKNALLWISWVPERGLIALDGNWLRVGPGADENTIATVVSRRIVQLILQRDDVPESRVRAEVKRWGFRYVKPEQRAKLISKARPRKSLSRAG